MKTYRERNGEVQCILDNRRTRRGAVSPQSSVQARVATQSDQIWPQQATLLSELSLRTHVVQTVAKSITK